jgi:SecD/SecF fusion protein
MEQPDSHEDGPLSRYVPDAVKPRAAAAMALLPLGVLAGCGSGSSHTPSATVAASEVPNGVALTYEARAYRGPVTPEKVSRAVEIMEARVRDIGFKAVVKASGDRIVVTLPGSVADTAGEPTIDRSAALYFYDWEPNVIGADGQPAPTESTVTGGPNAGASQFGLPEYRAVLRAAKRPPILRANDTTYAQGCTPAQPNGCAYGSWYLLDSRHHELLCAGGAACPPVETQGELTVNYTPPAGTAPRSVHVNPGTVLVQARPIETPSGKVTNSSPNSFYVLNDNPVLTGSDIAKPQQSYGEGDGNGQPNVTFGFTAKGKASFEQLTREVAHRGLEAQLPGVGKEAAEQHFAVVLDGQLVTTPSIDYTRYPEGIDANNGSEISGGFTVTSARELAAVLASGALPVRLALVSRSPQHRG